MSTDVNARMRRFRDRARYLLLHEACDEAIRGTNDQLAQHTRAELRGKAEGLRRAVRVLDQAFLDSRKRRK